MTILSGISSKKPNKNKQSIIVIDQLNSGKT